jgi:hypothetical protein
LDYLPKKPIIFLQPNETRLTPRTAPPAKAIFAITAVVWKSVAVNASILKTP